MKGFEGRIAHIDLSSGEVQTEVIPADLVRDFIGGSGLTARLLYDLLEEDTDPLGPDNPLLFMTGPMVGTSMPSAGRCTVSARSPLTGYWGESNTGGFIGPELRFAGYDGLLITGRAESPVWVSIIDGEVKIHDASDLWGLDTYETQQRIRNLLEEPKARIACIGSAGENMVRMAAVINDHGRAAGRTGMGAVMGSKKLKAVALRGNAEPPVADPEAYQQVVRDIYQELKDDLSVEALRMAGTAGYVDLGLMYGDMPIRYYQRGEWEEGGDLSGVLMAEEYQNRNTSCYRCPIACGRETRAPKYGLEEVDGPEYETVGAFGSLAMVDDLEGVIYAGHLCNRYGLDTISTGCTIALACEMFERGVLTEENTGGMRIEYGDVETTHSLIHMITTREGFGDVLAEGSDSLAAVYGVPDLAVTVKGLEVPMHDPRAFSGMAPVYALSPRGACHMQGDMYGVDAGQGPPVELGVTPGDRFEDSQEKGRIAARQQAWRSLYNAFTICQFMNPGVELLLRALNAATGWSFSKEDLLTTGKRIFTLKRMLNDKLGATRGDDDLPKLLKEPLAEGGTLGHVPELEPMLEGAYTEHGWDPETGKPTRSTLERLGLGFTLES
ncbi:MAG: aldehyde ferredoxin oxidoreductase family protein [Anaerolineales bacterium]